MVLGKGLTGKRVMIAASRKTEEMESLINKQGGEAVVRPLQGTTFLAEEELKSDLQKILDEQQDWYVFTTGMGLNSLIDVAEKMGEKEFFEKGILRANVAARGYKTANVLKNIGLTPDARDSDGTTSGLIRVLEDKNFDNMHVTVQLHGVRAPKLTEFLKSKGAASVTELLPYKHIAPESKTLEAVQREILSQSYDAICFTTQMQVHSLFRYAREQKFDKDLRAMFEKHTLAVAVGKVTAEALSEEGINRFLTPENERMGAMIVELSKSYI